MKTTALFLAIAICLSNLECHSQTLGDYRSRNNNGTWSTASDWEVLVVPLILPTWLPASSPPSANTNVYIQSGHTMNVAASAACADLHLNGNLGMGAGTFTINGNISYGSGKLLSNGSSSLVVNGSGSATLIFDQSNPGVTNRLLNLTVNRGTSPGSGTVSLGQSVQATGTVQLTEGTLQANGNLVLISDSVSTARIAVIDTSEADISGAVTVQRYIPGGDRDWLFLCAPVTTSAGLNGSWQQATFITGPVSTGGNICPSFSQNTSNGLDPTQAGYYSMYSYNEGTDTWTEVNNTFTTQLSPGKGFRIFYRGSRAQGCSLIDGSDATPSGTVLSASGTIGKGTVSVSAIGAATGWVLAGNPYPSSIDWDAPGWNTERTSGANDFDNAVYIYNPAVNGYTSYVDGVSDGNGATGIISQGQSFFVRAANATSVLRFTEGYKTSSQNNLFGKTHKPQIDLVLSGPAGQDHTVICFDPRATRNFDRQFDAVKFAFRPGALASYSSDDTLMLSVQAIPAEGNRADTVLLHAELGASPASWSLAICKVIAWPADKNVLLVDRFTGRTFHLRSPTETYRFVSTDEDASRASDRFFIVLSGQRASGGAGVPLSVSVSPNPVTDGQLRIENSEDENVVLCVYTMAGQRVWMHEVQPRSTVVVQTPLPAGIYVIEKRKGVVSQRELIIAE